MVTREHALLAVSLLEEVAAGRLSSGAALEKWGPVNQKQDPLMDEAWHALSHYHADEDIRIKDPEYGADQVAQLLSYAARIYLECG